MKRPGRQTTFIGIASFPTTVPITQVGGILVINAKDITNILQRDIDMTMAKGNGADPTGLIVARRRVT